MLNKKEQINILLIASIVVISAIIYKSLVDNELFSISNVKENYLLLKQIINSNYILSCTVFFVFYIFIAAFAIPLGTLLTISISALVGFWPSLIIVSFSSTIGATICFLVVRYLIRDFIYKKFTKKTEAINFFLSKDGLKLLFFLRLNPIVPFFLINLLFGLSKIKVSSFYMVSQIGMLAGTIVYINAGAQIQKINSINDIINFNIMASFLLLGLFPFLIKFISKKLQSKLTFKGFDI